MKNLRQPFLVAISLALVVLGALSQSRASFTSNQTNLSSVLSEGDSNSPTPTTSTCSPPSSGCGSNYYWNTSSCSCEPQAGTCAPPYNGCPSGTTFNSTTCQCVASTSCTQPSGGCGTNYYWNSTTCTCQAYSSCQPPSSGCGN